MKLFYFSDDYHNHNRVANPMPVTLLLTMSALQYLWFSLL